MEFITVTQDHRIILNGREVGFVQRSELGGWIGLPLFAVTLTKKAELARLAPTRQAAAEKFVATLPLY